VECEGFAEVAYDRIWTFGQNFVFRWQDYEEIKKKRGRVAVWRKF
jgi:hypothetical protein